MRRAVTGLGLLLLLGVGTSTCDDAACQENCAGPTVVMTEYTDGSGFFDAPFPSDARRRADGRPDVTGFPNPQANELVSKVLSVLENDAEGFGVSSGIFFRTTAALDPATLPTLAGSVEPTSSVQLIGLDVGAGDYLKRYPIHVHFADDAGPYGATNLVSVVPLQGIPLRAKTRYALVVTRQVKDAQGNALGASTATQDLYAGRIPAGMTEVEANAHRIFPILTEAGLAQEDVAAFTVFTTGDPIATMQLAFDRMREQPTPTPNEPFTKTDDFRTYCVYESTIDMPVFQAGTPPYSSEGGGFVLDAGGVPILQRTERARIVVTVPKSWDGVDSLSTVVFSRTGGGGDRPLVDRGARATNGGDAIEPGTGPALEFARAGWAGVSIDGPHGGLRNPTNADEQLLVFNFQNPLALRDNIRQSALELALTAEILDDLHLDASDCTGIAQGGALVGFNARALMGHSMGASIAPLAIVYEPRYWGLVLSGAGGSFIENMLHKQKPLPVKAFGELALGLTFAGFELEQGTPILSMLQWAGEPADSPVYGRHIVHEPLNGSGRHVLMLQGIVDQYIMPPIANAASLSFGLDLAGGSLDAQSAELASLDPLASLLLYSGRSEINLPAFMNGPGGTTAVVVQTEEDGIEDGHEVAFQLPGPKHAYGCFLMTMTDTPRVPSRGVPGDPCD